MKRTALPLKIVSLILATCLSAATTAVGQTGRPPAGAPPRVVSPPPAALRLPPFFQKYVDAGGIKIITSAKVPDEALIDTHRWVTTMLARNASIHAVMAKHGAAIVILADDELITDVPGMEDLPQKFPKQDWVRRRGGGGTLGRPITFMDAQHVLHQPGDRFPTENNMVHEFGHTVDAIGLALANPQLRSQIDVAYEQAKAKGLWKGTFAISTRPEYWAEGTQSWFDCNRANDKDHNDIDTRAEIKRYDPALAKILATVYGDLPNQAAMKRRGE